MPSKSVVLENLSAVGQKIVSWDSSWVRSIQPPTGRSSPSSPETCHEGGSQTSNLPWTSYPPRPLTDLWDEDLRRAIHEADEVVVICGEHSNCSGRMGAELRITREEERPYLLLWGRRELMCTRPATAGASDSMYSWTKEILEQQIRTRRRSAPSNGRAAGPRRTKEIAKVERIARAAGES